MSNDAGLRPGLIGARVVRVEDPRLLAGKGSFTDDLNPAGVLHVAFRRSDHAYARILSTHLDAAAAFPGVVGVFDAASLAGLVKPLRASSRMKDYHATELFPLARDVVRYVGEPVVAVVAESRYIAEDAVELVEIGYQPLSIEIDVEAAARDDAPVLHESAGTNVILKRGFGRGDVDAAFAIAARRVGGRFRIHRKTPVAMENRSYLAEWDAGRRALTLTGSTQVPGIIRDALAEALDMAGQRVRVVARDVGGGFGGKASLYQEELLVAVIAKHLECAVKWTSDRLEDLATTSQAFDETIDAELAIDADGLLLALRADVLGDIGAYSIYPWTAALEPVQVVSFMPGPYRIAAYRGEVRGIATPKAPTGPYRGVGRPAAAFVMERLIDMAAAKLGLDPVLMRRRNLVGADEFPYKTGSGLVWDRSAFVECLDAVADVAGYASLREQQSIARASGKWTGIGVACYAELTGIGSRISAAPGMPINTGTETATIRIDSMGGVTASFGVASHGQGLETTLAQVVADELGCRIADISIVQGDSAGVANATGTYASRSTVLAGGAAIMASREVQARVKRAAAHLMEADVIDIEARDGLLRIAGTDRTLTFREVARAVYSEMGRIPREIREELEATKTYDPFFGTATSATHVATVEIDPETYGVRVTGYWVAEDCGRIINPMIVDGQVHGGVVQGIGVALLEEVVYDETGQVTTASLADYLIPAAGDVPRMSVMHVEAPLPNTLGGFRGMGEGGTIGAPAAIANAVADALAPMLARSGQDLTVIPITPERIYQMIRKAKEHEA